MLRNSLSHLPQIVLLRNDKIFHKLIEDFLSDRWSNEDNFSEFFSGLRDFYPNYYRMDDLELSITGQEITCGGVSYDELSGKVQGEEYSFDFIEQLFDYFFEFDGSQVVAKREVLEEYLALITKVSPLQIIGYKLMKEYLHRNMSEEDVAISINAYKPLGFHVDTLEKYADNHIHLNGAGYLAFNMYQLFTSPTPPQYYRKDFLHELPRINEFSHINNFGYSIGQIVDILKLCMNTVYRSFMQVTDENEEGKKPSYYREDFLEKLHKIIIYNQPFGEAHNYSIESLVEMNGFFPVFANQPEENLARYVLEFYQKNEFSQAHLMEYVLFFYCFEKSNSSFLKRIVRLLMHCINILRSYMVMSQNYGLGHFSEFSRSRIRQVERRSAESTVKGIVRSGTTSINTKIGIPKLEKEGILNNHLLDLKNAFKQVDITYNFGLCSTKEREKERQTITGDLLPRFYHKRQRLKGEALAIDDLRRNVHYKTLDAFQIALQESDIQAYVHKHKYEGKVYDSSQLVVAIDAVGKETHTPPEVFAPFFRYLRNPPKRLKNNIYQGLKQFQLPPQLLITVHAGEDFNHIVTGMRRVDECVSFFEMKRRDRLGHVLSLGITPEMWLNSVADVMVTKGDYFDDLVWLCWRLKKISASSLDISRWVRVYEDRLWELFAEIYPMMDRQSVRFNHLYEAWKYRKNCIVTSEKDEQGVFLFDDYSLCVYDEKKSSETVKEIFNLYHTNRVVRQKSKEVLKIDKHKVAQEELMIWEALQDSMIEGMAKKGIIIETNPSSNIFISALGSYEAHPIFRFHPPKHELLESGQVFNKYGQRQGSIDVTINSDDPAIFVTSLQNEFNVLKNVAKNRYNCTDKEADNWLNEIREFGVKIFKESYRGNLEDNC